MAEETTEVAGTAQPAATGEGSSQGAPDVSGFQARINELTAGMREAQRAAEEAKAGFQQAMQQVARLEGQVSAGTRPQQKEPEVDYSVFGDAAAPLKAVLDAQAAQFQRQLASMNATMAAQLRASEVTSIAAQRGYPPSVAERAKALAADWAARGLNFPAEDSVRFALAEAVESGQYVPQARVPGGRAMGSPPSGATLAGGVPPVMPHAPSGNGQPKGLVLPTNFEDMSPSQQAQYLAQTKQNVDFEF